MKRRDLFKKTIAALSLAAVAPATILEATVSTSLTPPKKDANALALEYWEEERRRLMYGHTLPDGTYLTGHSYYLFTCLQVNGKTLPLETVLLFQHEQTQLSQKNDRISQRRARRASVLDRYRKGR